MTLEKSIRWKGREAARLANGLVELVVLSVGGHFAELRFISGDEAQCLNVLWESPWMTPAGDISGEHISSQTGGFTGHALCLDYFGPPSIQEAAAGLPIHGEAATQQWKLSGMEGDTSTSCRWNVELPAAQITFERIAQLAAGESVVCVEEIVRNHRDMDHFCHWVEHATFAPPFLNSGQSTVELSGVRGLTSPFAYLEENGSLLACNQEFAWPHAPHSMGDGRTVNLRRPFSEDGRGFLAAVEIDPERQVQFVVAINWNLRVGVGYCFSGADFPWVAIWEENRARQQPPWNGTTQARGMEFGTTPLPLGREEIFRSGNLLGKSGWCVIPAQGERSARYLMFLFAVPTSVNAVDNVEVAEDAIFFIDNRANLSFSIPAHGCGDFLKAAVRPAIGPMHRTTEGEKQW